MGRCIVACQPPRIIQYSNVQVATPHGIFLDQRLIQLSVAKGQKFKPKGSLQIECAKNQNILHTFNYQVGQDFCSSYKKLVQDYSEGGCQ